MSGLTDEQIIKVAQETAEVLSDLLCLIDNNLKFGCVPMAYIRAKALYRFLTASPTIPEGYALVPIEPTSKMREALESIAAISADRAIRDKPVGEVVTVGGYPDDSEHRVEWLVKFKELKHGDLLYTRPPPAEDKLETVMPDGTTWQTYALSYESDGMTYCFNIMAYSAYHATLMLEDLKKTAVLDGKVIEVIPND